MRVPTTLHVLKEMGKIPGRAKEAYAWEAVFRRKLQGDPLDPKHIFEEELGRYGTKDTGKEDSG